VRIQLQTLLKVVVSLVAIAIVIIALRAVNVAQALQILLNANPFVLVAVLLTQAAGVFVRAVRWQYQLLPARRVAIGALVSPLLVSFAVGNVTVTGVGAVPRIYLLNRRTGADTDNKVVLA